MLCNFDDEIAVAKNNDGIQRTIAAQRDLKRLYSLNLSEFFLGTPSRLHAGNK